MLGVGHKHRPCVLGGVLAPARLPKSLHAERLTLAHVGSSKPLRVLRGEGEYR